VTGVGCHGGGPPPCDARRRRGWHLARTAVVHIAKAGHQGRAEGRVVTWLMLVLASILRRCLSPRLSPLCTLLPTASGMMTYGALRFERLTAVAHRRAGFLRPSPSVPTRGLRCGGASCGCCVVCCVALALLFAVRVALSRLLCCLGQGRERGMSDRCGALDVALRACGPVL
jgi:hypothetical protein